EHARAPHDPAARPPGGARPQRASTRRVLGRRRLRWRLGRGERRRRAARPHWTAIRRRPRPRRRGPGRPGRDRGARPAREREGLTMMPVALAASAVGSAVNLLSSATTGTTSATGTDASAKTTSTATKANDVVNQADFMQLLIAQLQNQDPLNPLDSANFSA